MNPTLKKKLIMFVAMISFMALYMIVFGSKNAIIGFVIMLAAFMNLGNDLSFKPTKSFIKVAFLLLILGVSAYLNNPLTIWGCILTFMVVFGTTFKSYSMFGSRTYLPDLMCYFMMISAQVTLENLPVRLLALIFGAVFIVGLNIAVNKEKDYKLSKATIERLVGELDNAIDLRLNGEDVSHENFKTASGLYSAIYNKFEYKYFPTKNHQRALNIIKSFQYVGFLIADNNLAENELRYVKEVLSRIREIIPEDIFGGVEVETKEMPLVLLNLEILASEVKKDLSDSVNLQDKKTIKALVRTIVKNEFSFKSPKFIFAFKMALILFVWQILTLMFNLPFTKWLYFITLPLMMPYIDDLADMAKARIKGTFLGVFIFAVILLLVPYISIPIDTFSLILFGICMFVMVFKMEDKFILSAASTVMSVMTALMYINPPQAMTLKLLWVVVGVIVVSAFNFKFLPYSVEKETENNLKASYELNRRSIDLIKEKCNGVSSDEKTTLLVVSNIFRENIEVTDENKELYNLQMKITDFCNFILNYLDIHKPSDDLKVNLRDIICDGAEVNDNLNFKDGVIACSMKYVMNLFKKEKEIVRS